MKTDFSQLFSGLQERYSIPEATAAINALLAPFGQTCKIEFRQFDAEIIDSYRIKSASLRTKICEIMRRTGVTERTHGNLSAEWVLHNAAHRIRLFPKDAKDVSLNYEKDPRFPVAIVSDVLEKLHIR